jgi:ZIP family zinc transporter
MLASTMMPEAYEEGGAVVGLVTTIGFLAAFVLSRLEG